MNQADLIRKLPKAELHVHIEGTLEPEMMFELARRNGVQLRFATVEQVKAAYEFNNLQSFLDIYYEGANVLRTEHDFFDLTMAYLNRCREDQVVHTEIFFDPQTHMERGISLRTAFAGISGALREAESKWKITSRLIPCFLRHLSEEEARKTFDATLEFKELITAFGLDSSEVGHPPAKFKRVFDRARAEGFLTVAHAGEEGPPEYIWEAIDLLGASRVDHGVRSIEDERLLRKLIDERIPLTVCPLSNVKLCVYRKMQDHVLKRLLEAGVLVTINSDDPAYFGGYINKNYIEAASALDLTSKEIIQIAKNSFRASFLSQEEKSRWLSRIDAAFGA